MALPNEIHPFAIAGGGNQYQIANSLRFRASNSAYVKFNHADPTLSGANNYFTFSLWIKRSQMGVQQCLLGLVYTAGLGDQYQILLQNTDVIDWYQYRSDLGYDFRMTTNRVIRDPSAWYHLLFYFTTSEARIYVNGVRETSFSTNTQPVRGSWLSNNTANMGAYLGAQNRNNASALAPFDGYMSEVYLIDGQALTPDYFGQTDSITGQWVPKKYTGTYANYSWYLPFNDATSTTTLGYDRQLGMSDSSKNNSTLYNFSLTSGRDYDSMIDSPTAYNDGSTYYNRGNYCTINPLDALGSAPPTLSEGNLRTTSIFAGNAGGYNGTIGVTTGKWYFEVEPISNGGYGETFVGITGGGNAGYWCGGPAATYSAYGIYAVAFDVDAGKFWIKLASSGNWASGDPALGTSASANFTAGSTITPRIYNNRSTGFNNSGIGVWNFGQRPFNYTPPTGYKALNTYNLADPSLPLV